MEYDTFASGDVGAKLSGRVAFLVQNVVEPNSGVDAVGCLLKRLRVGEQKPSLSKVSEQGLLIYMGKEACHRFLS
jgi:hypothetical protein